MNATNLTLAADGVFPEINAPRLVQRLCVALRCPFIIHGRAIIPAWLYNKQTVFLAWRFYKDQVQVLAVVVYVRKDHLYN